MCGTERVSSEYYVSWRSVGLHVGGNSYNTSGSHSHMFCERAGWGSQVIS